MRMYIPFDILVRGWSHERGDSFAVMAYSRWCFGKRREGKRGKNSKRLSSSPYAKFRRRCRVSRASVRQVSKRKQGHAAFFFRRLARLRKKVCKEMGRKSGKENMRTHTQLCGLAFSCLFLLSHYLSLLHKSWFPVLRAVCRFILFIFLHSFSRKRLRRRSCPHVDSP